MQIIIVVPCYNESERIHPATFINFARQYSHIHFLFVNDGSSDSTAKILDEITRKMPEAMNVLHLKKNSGKAEAVRQGFLRSFTMNPEIVGFIDADLASPLECILELENAMTIEQKEIVMGTRVALLGRTVDRNPIRHYTGRCFATAASIVLRLCVYDTQCGAKIFLVTERLKKVFATPFTVNWIFDVEMLARFLIMEHDGAPKVSDICLEYPIKKWTDKKGSKIRPIDFFISGLDLLKIFFLLQSKKKSTHKTAKTV